MPKASGSDEARVLGLVESMDLGKAGTVINMLVARHKQRVVDAAPDKDEPRPKPVQRKKKAKKNASTAPAAGAVPGAAAGTPSRLFQRTAASVGVSGDES